MNIHNKLEISTSNGPGVRACIWVQGCSLSCSGCWNPETHKHGLPNTSILDLAKWVIDNREITGLTISGGEPFQQAPALELLLALIKSERSKLTIGIYTGYTLKELQEGNFSWYSSAYEKLVPGDIKLAQDILKHIDFLIAGRFNQDQTCDNKSLCGSKNQQIHLLSKAYTIVDFKANSVDINIDEEANLIQITGFPDAEKLKDLTKDNLEDEDGGNLVGV